MNTIEKNVFMREHLVNAPSVEAAKANLDAEKSELNFYNYGLALSRERRNEEAIDAYSKGLIMYPLSALLHFGRGRKYMHPGTYDQAIADFTMALTIESDVNMFWYYRAVTHNVNGRFHEAIADFTEAMKYAEPQDRYSMADWIFSCYVDLGDMEGARKALDLVPDDMEVPDMDWDYKTRVRLYKGCIKPEDVVDPVEIRKHVPDPDDDLKLDIVTLRFGLYLYYTYKGETEKANEEIVKIIRDPYEGAFAVEKARLVAKERGLT